MNGDTPVNVFGVLAFPNDADGGLVRFIDSDYNTLFHVPDGENIILTTFGDDGKRRSADCVFPLRALRGISRLRCSDKRVLVAAIVKLLTERGCLCSRASQRERRLRHLHHLPDQGHQSGALCLHALRAGESQTADVPLPAGLPGRAGSQGHFG